LTFGPVEGAKKKELSCVKQAICHIDLAPEIWHAGSCPGDSCIFQVSDENWQRGLRDGEGLK